MLFEVGKPYHPITLLLVFTTPSAPTHATFSLVLSYSNHTLAVITLNSSNNIKNIKKKQAFTLLKTATKSSYYIPNYLERGRTHLIT